MSHVRDIEGRITDWFQADATSAGSDRVLAEALSRVSTAPQEAHLWRVTGMQAHGRIEASRSGRSTLAAGVALLMIMLAISLVPSLTKQDGAATSASPARAMATSDTIAAWPFEMRPGAYGGIVDGISFTFRLPDNGWWSGEEAGSLYFRDDPMQGWLRFWDPHQVYADPCAHTLKAPIGPSAAELADAMASIPGMRSTGVTDTVVGGFPAKHLRLTATGDMACIPHDFYLWGVSGPVESSIRRPRLDDSLINVWVVEVDGRRFVIDSDAGLPADVDAASGIQAVVASLTITPISEDVLSYVGRVADICTGAAARMTSDPAVVGGFRQAAPGFDTLDEAAAHADAAASILGDALSDLRALPVPPDVAATNIDPFGLVAKTIDYLHEIASFARVRDETGVSSRLVDAYAVTNRGLAPSHSPTALWLLDAGLSGCRLPSAGG